MSTLDTLRRDLLTLIHSVKGLQAIVITDRDGVALIKVNSELAPELSMRPAFLASTVVTSEQCSKLGSGKCKAITCFYENYQVVHFNKNPLLITLIASINANTGMIKALETQFEPILTDLKKVVNA
ncbi:hypothetical protein B4U79_08212 [Dinothrombium tinctorium]|uniref:Uncharacterized protein n=1 Tax=Dinothrombium tinctorium TaxID=1965070 RepID=A0A443R6R8_9ACAR|nr:hypothetical protein B4U79_12325 [Dinothrombium tinctorium]RWS10932.1 hypothetical protein B4U79_04284 [Dinothrombium tinctorium]RWS10970.1 hypothetical protein B4U79_08212 [Dinothrombium tinctorium]